MQKDVGRSRIWSKYGRAFLVTEASQEVLATLEQAEPNEFLLLTSVTGQAAFPPEMLAIRADEITSIQEVSAESWIWQQRADELHYARQIQEQSEGERYLEGVREMLQGMVHGEEEE